MEVVKIQRLVTIVLIGMILIISYAVIFCTPKEEFYYMTSTGYSDDPRCISDRWRDGFTATGTKVREGVVAINVDWIEGKWRVRSPLRLGDEIYIVGMGHFSVEDTGCFTEEDFHFDIWNLDVFYKEFEDAEKHGVRSIKVYVLDKEE